MITISQAVREVLLEIGDKRFTSKDITRAVLDAHRGRLADYHNERSINQGVSSYMSLLSARGMLEVHGLDGRLTSYRLQSLSEFQRMCRAVRERAPAGYKAQREVTGLGTVSRAAAPHNLAKAVKLMREEAVLLEEIKTWMAMGAELFTKLEHLINRCAKRAEDDSK